MWGQKQQWISHKINIRHPWQLKKSKSWEPFWSYQLYSSANLAFEKLSEIKPPLKLPISAISYGKMIFEAQAAKVLLGPLVCQPKEDLYNSEEHLNNIEKKIDDKFTSHDSRIEELEEKLNETNDNMVQKAKLSERCLNNVRNYHMIDGYCLYFETQSFDYERAQQNCATKFSGGKIFAPLTSIFNVTCIDKL